MVATLTSSGSGEVAVRRFLYAVITAVALLATNGIRQVDPDLYGYLAYGRLFLQEGGPVTSDPFAYTSAGYSWYAFEYGAQVLFWLAYRAAGGYGLILLKMIVGSACAWFIYRATDEVSVHPALTLAVFALAFTTTARYFVFRPQLFTFAFFALFVWLLIRRLLGRPSPLVVFPVVTVFWANLHGGFLAGLGAIGLAILLTAAQHAVRGGWRSALSATRALWLALVACILASFVNPRGPWLWSYLLHELGHGTNRRYIDEWRPATLSRDAWSFVALTCLVVLVVGFAMATRRLRSIAGLRPWHWAASCFPLSLAAYLSVRHVPLASLWIAPVLALLASCAWSSRAGERRTMAWWVGLGAAACLPGLITGALVLQDPWPRVKASGRVLGSTHPCGAIRFMKEQALRGNLYLPLWWGGYATWELHPRVKVSMDGRNISLFDDRLVLENLRFYAAEPGYRDAGVPLRHPTDFLLIPSDSPILTTVQADDRWAPFYMDHESVLFGRKEDRWIEPKAVTATQPVETRGCPAFLE